MKTKLLLFLNVVFCCIGLQANAQTLVPGDVVIIGVSVDTVGDEFSWMPLINLNAGTVIYFTDAGWNTVDQSFNGAASAQEILLKYTTPVGGILAGQVQTVYENMTLSPNYVAVTGTRCGDDSSLTMANSGDQITAFTSNLPINSNFGTLGNGVAGNLVPLFSVTLSSLSWTASTGNIASYSSSGPRNNVTNLVPGLTDGTNAVAAGTGPLELDESDNARYEGILTGSRSVLLAAISNRAANWKRYDATAGAEFPDIASVPQGWTNKSGANFSVTGSDNIVPVVQSISLIGTPAANSASVTFAVTFDETVSNVSIDDFTVATVSGNATGTVSGISGSGNSYTLTVSSITGTGSFKVNLKASTNIIDAYGNGNGTNGFVATYTSGGTQTVDRDSPTITMSSLQGNPTNVSSITVNITFSESVLNFALGDISITNGTASVLSGGGASYSIAITPTTNGTVTVAIPANVANDAANNNNLAASNFTITSDRTQPSVSITSTATDPTNVASFSATITFSESVTNFVVGDIIAGNAALSGFSGSGSSYSVTVTPSADGTVTLNIGAGVAIDAANNGNTAAIQFIRNSDRSTPTVFITSAATNPTNSNPIPVAVTFSESVINFVAGDISVSNGTVSSFSGVGANYTFNIIPSANGTVTVNIAANVANDTANNGNTAAAQLSRTFDSVSPTVSMSSATTSPTNASSFSVAVAFSESVTGFTASDISVGNASLSNFSGSGNSYSFTLTPAAAGTVTASIVGGIAFDVAGNGNAAATTFSIVYDNSQPSVSITSATSSPTNTASFNVNFNFSESVAGFTSSDVSVGNGTISNFSGSGSSYSATIAPSAGGTVTVNVAANTATDAAGNGNTAATQFSITYDNSQPSVSITSAATSPTNVNSFTVTFTFSENVVNFIAGDVSVGNGTLSNFTGSGTTYSATISPSVNGTVTVNVAAAVATDVAGNSNTAATQFSLVSDKTSPTVAITSTATSPTNANTIPLTFTFSESVTGFISSDISVSGGTISAFSGSGSAYTATLTPSGDGNINIFVFQDTSNDAAGNGNTFATFSITSDKTKPTVSITSTESTPTSANPIPISFNFSESTSNFAITDITVTGGTLSGFSGSGTSYSVNLIPSGSGSKTVRLLAGVMSDAAGNTNNASTNFSIFYLPACSTPTTWNGLFWTNGYPIATQPAVITADYFADTDLSACSLIIGNNAQVVVNSGVDITITGTVNVQVGSTFTFEGGANLIQSGSTNTNVGNIIYKRPTTIRRLDYTYWSSPVGSQNLKAFSPMTVSPPVGASRFYILDEPTNAFVAIDPLVTSFTAGKGYNIRAPNDFPTTPEPWTGIFTGIPNNGNVSIAVTATPGLGFNMLGNPYPSTIDANLFLNSNPGTLYFWTHILQGAPSGSNYASYNLTGGTASLLGGEVPNGTIQAGQGFFIQKSNGGTATFTNAMRVGNNDSQFFRNANDNDTVKSRIWLNLSMGETPLNQILVGYMPGATLAADESFDGKLLDSGSTISSLIDNANYVIQARPVPFNDSDVVSLNFKAATAGTYKIAVDHLDGLFAADQDIFLQDNLTGTIQNIKQNPYVFASAEGSFANRFAIVYQNTTLGVTVPAMDEKAVVIYKSGQALVVNSGNAVMDHIKIFDMRGRLVYEKDNLNASQATLSDLKAEQQVLLVQIVSSDQKVVTKKVVY